MTLNRNCAIAAGLVALVGASIVPAEELRKAHVPFAFEAAGQRFEAGTYALRRQNTGGSMWLRNDTAGQAAYLTPVPVGKTKSADRSSLTFRCYASQCFLAKFQFSGTQTVYAILPSKQEKELAGGERPKAVMVATR